MLLRRTVLATLFTACAALAGSAMAAELPEAISTLLSAANIPLQGAGIVVMRGNQTLIDHNSSQSMQPGSTMKLITTLAALEQLGPAFRARTELRTSAEVENGVLKGDLIVRGGADVDLNEDVLLHLLQALRNQGIRKIKGDVILDRQLFQPARSELTVGMQPEMEQVSVKADLALIDAPCASWEKDWRMPEVRRRGEQLTVVLHGRYPRNCNKST